MDPGEGPRGPRRHGPVPLPGHSCRPILPAGATRRGRHPQVLVPLCQDDQANEEGSGVVGSRPHPEDLRPDLAPRGDRIHALRLFELRLGRRPEQLRGSTGFLVRPGPPAPHHVEGAQGGPLRGRVFLERAEEALARAARGQPVRRLGVDKSDIEIAGHDVRAAQALPPPRLQRDTDPTPVHPVCRQHLGGPFEQGARPSRLAAAPPSLRVLERDLGSSHSGPLRLAREPPATALQRPLAGWHSRGSGLLEPPRLLLDRGEQLVQPTLGPHRRPGRQAAAVGGFGHRHRSPMADQALVPPPVRDGLRVHRLPSDPRPLLSVEAARARGGRASRLERRGLPATRIPAWQLMRSRELHQGQHFPRQRVPGAALGAMLPRSRRPPRRRYDLRLPR